MPYFEELCRRHRKLPASVRRTRLGIMVMIYPAIWWGWALPLELVVARQVRDPGFVHPRQGA